jgi:hypothetical protein
MVLSMPWRRPFRPLLSHRTVILAPLRVEDCGMAMPFRAVDSANTFSFRLIRIAPYWAVLPQCPATSQCLTGLKAGRGPTLSLRRCALREAPIRARGAKCPPTSSESSQTACYRPYPCQRGGNLVCEVLAFPGGAYANLSTRLYSHGAPQGNVLGDERAQPVPGRFLDVSVQQVSG